MTTSSRGFTLIEVMVALAIVAFALTAIAASMNQMIDSATAMRDRTYASWIAQNKIVEFRLDDAVPEVSTTSGEVEFANNRWSWRAVVSETGIQDFMRVDVSISFADQDYVVRTVTGFVGRPMLPGVANQQWGQTIVEGPTE